MTRWVRLLALMFVPALPAQDQESVTDRIVKEGKDNSKVMEHLDHLVNKIGPRLTSSDNLTRACEWAKSQFEAFGCKNVRLEEWGTFPVGFNRGPWSGKANVDGESTDLVCGTMSWTPGTDGPKEGPAVMAPATEEEIDKDKLKGAWVLVGGGSRATDLKEKLGKAYEEAGILGFVRSSSGELIITSGNSKITWDKLPTRVTVAVVKSQFKKIVESVQAKKKVNLTFDIKNEFKKGPVAVYNVIAEIPGTDKSDEYVIVGGHIDSWDGATGTTDNGTGVATTLEAARLLCKAEVKPKRTIRFMLWSGEEEGLLGSRAWIKKHPDELKKISAVLVHDGGTNYVSGIQATKSLAPIFEKVFEPAMKLDEAMKFEIKKVDSLPVGIGSDHDSFLISGVPGFFWAQKGKAKYTETHHTQHDTYDRAIPEYQRHSAIVIAIGALGIANLDELLPRKELKATGPRRMLGVSTDNDNVVTGVSEDSPAAKAGIQAGDKILKIGAAEVKDIESLRAAINKAEKQTKAIIERDGKPLELPVTFEN